MKISYAICVCNEHEELNALLSFLSNVADEEDEINILVDSGKVTDEVKAVLKEFENRVTVNERMFCGNFSKHRTITSPNVPVNTFLSWTQTRSPKKR
jgi:hypothetical protein